jgi:hypothetical protein
MKFQNVENSKIDGNSLTQFLIEVKYLWRISRKKTPEKIRRMKEKFSELQNPMVRIQIFPGCAGKFFMIRYKSTIFWTDV